MYHMTQLNTKTLEQLLLPSLTWCAPYIDKPPTGIDVSAVFRSPSLRLKAMSVFPDSCHTDYTAELEHQFAIFIQAKSRKTTSQPLDINLVRREVQRDGSLLITDWQASLFDGAMTPETDGFLNEDGMPPWDTWCALVKVPGSVGGVCLLSWVPKWLSEKVDFAILVDAASSLSWLKLAGNESPVLSGWGERWAA